MVLLIPLLLFSGYIEKEISYSRADLTFEKFEGYDIVRLAGCQPTTVIGEPQLAIDPLLFLIPPTAEIEEIEILSAKKTLVNGSFNILPTQYPRPFSLDDVSLPFVKPKKEIYNLDTEYPGIIAEVSHIGTKGGYRIATVTIHPLQYVPVDKALYLYTDIKLRIRYEEGRVEEETVWLEQYEMQKAAVRRLVENPEDVEVWGPAVRECSRGLSFGERGPTFTNPEYVIMAPSAYTSYFQGMRDWKSKKGVPTEVIELEWILSNYSGSNDQTKVRNFIIDYNTNHGTQYFLCVGDFDVFPMNLVNTVDDPNTPSDFWYADYDDDLYTEAYIGRASVSNATEVQTFINKAMQYETNAPSNGYHEKIFLPAYLLWSGYGCPVNDTIAKYDPSSWLDAKRYDEIDPLSTQEISDSLNVGFGYTNIAAHGDWDRWGGTSYHTNADADALTNAPPRTGVMTAISCNIGQLDYSSGDCYVEHIMNNPNGGAVTFWGNSRHGYGQIDNYGRSEWQCIWFYDELTNNNVYRIGNTIGEVNDRCAPYAPGDEYVFHCMNTCVLFGDPEMSMWIYTPQDLVVTHNSLIPLGSGTFTVTVEDNRAPVQNARVCLMSKLDTLYRCGYTNASGIVTFNTSTDTEGDTVWVTVSKLDYRPYEGYAITTLVGVDEWNGCKPIRFALAPPHPNPAYGRLTFWYSLPQSCEASLRVYDATGQLVKELISGHHQVGTHQVVWNSEIDDVPAGVYFVRLIAQNRVAQQKIIIVKN